MSVYFKGAMPVVNTERIAKALYALDAECRYIITEDGLYCTLIDPSNVAMIEIQAHPSAFESFEQEGGPVMGVPLKRMTELCKLGKKGQLHQFEYDAEKGILQNTIGDVSMGMRLIDPDSMRTIQDIPDLSEQITATYQFDESYLGKVIKAGSLCSDHVRFTNGGSDDPQLRAISEGDIDSCEIELGGDTHISQSVDDRADTLLSIAYLSEIYGGVPKNAEMTIKLGQEIPMTIEYDLVENMIKAQCMIAPRVESD